MGGPGRAGRVAATGNAGAAGYRLKSQTAALSISTCTNRDCWERTKKERKNEMERKEEDKKIKQGPQDQDTARLRAFSLANVNSILPVSYLPPLLRRR